MYKRQSQQPAACSITGESAAESSVLDDNMDDGNVTVDLNEVNDEGTVGQNVCFFCSQAVKRKNNVKLRLWATNDQKMINMIHTHANALDDIVVSDKIEIAIA